MNNTENDMSEGECLDDSLDAREDLWDIQEMLYGHSARTLLNGTTKVSDFDTDKCLQMTIEETKNAYMAVKSANIGDEVVCAICSKKFIKKTKTQAFCSYKGGQNCKDKYWNTVDLKRRERALKYMK